MWLLIEFLREKHDQRYPEDIEDDELNEYFCEFMLSVKRKDGKDFEPSRLRGMFSSFNPHLKDANIPSVSSKDVAFERARKCLEAKNKQLKVSAGLKKANFQNFRFRNVQIKPFKSFLLKKIPQKNIISVQSYWTLKFTTS